MDRGDLGPSEIGDFFARLIFFDIYVGLLHPPVVVPLLHPPVVVRLLHPPVVVPPFGIFFREKLCVVVTPSCGGAFFFFLVPWPAGNTDVPPKYWV